MKIPLIIGLAAVLGTMSTPAARAQTRPAPSNEALDYSMLNNRVFDFFDLNAAKAHSLSDRQVATILKIARLSGKSFHVIGAAVYQGGTFRQIAWDHNVPYSALKNVVQEEDDIASYTAAYLSTGSAGQRRQPSYKS